MRSTSIAIMTTFAALTAISAAADERRVQLTQGPGVDKVEAHCSTCHSLDYVLMNSPFLSAAGWDAEVAKMINAFGAPIDRADAETIADYLKKYYGIESLDERNRARSAGTEENKSVPKPPSSNFGIAEERPGTPRAAAIRRVQTTALSNGPRSKTATRRPAADAKAMLERTITELKANETTALAKFKNADGGFRDRDLYVFCFNATTGIFNAHIVPTLMGTDIRLAREADGSPSGQKIFDAVKEGTITTVSYNFPKPNTTNPVPKKSYVIRVRNEACGVGYYK
jgi:hypothetical protein